MSEEPLFDSYLAQCAQHPSSPPTKKATETRLGVHDGHFTTKSFVKSKAVSALFC